MIPLNIIRKWPEGFQKRLDHVWDDVRGFIPNVRLWDLQRVLAEYGFRMEIHEDAAAQAGAPQAVTDEQIMEIGHRHFKPNPDLTDSAKAAFVASVRECIALAATQPNAADVMFPNVDGKDNAVLYAAPGDGQGGNPWKAAIDEALIVNCLDCIGPNDDPTKTLARLIGWEVRVALDPAVSQAAADLIEQGKALAAPSAVTAAREQEECIHDFQPHGRGNTYCTKCSLTPEQVRIGAIPPALDDPTSAARAALASRPEAPAALGDK